MTIQGILLDIEGTTSSISFVHDQMFPFARKHVKDYLAENWGKPQLLATLDLLAVDAGSTNAANWLDNADPTRQQEIVVSEVERLMDGDVKATGLKQLQGEIWRAGFESGQLVAHLWPDVPEALSQWRTQGIDLRIYSSGSVAAQKMFFGHSVAGDLLHRFSGHYDTKIGGKKEAASYTAIAEDWNLPPDEILFISDVIEELEAASTAGLQTCLSIRPGNLPVPQDHQFASTTDFRQLAISAK